MTLEDHVVSLELANELEEAGYPQLNSYFVWRVNSGLAIGPTQKLNRVRYELSTRILTTGRYIAAPLASELGEKLPSWIDRDGKECLTLVCTKGPTDWGIYYSQTGNHADSPEFGGSEANVRAQMYIYLKKERLI